MWKTLKEEKVVFLFTKVIKEFFFFRSPFSNKRKSNYLDILNDHYRMVAEVT